MIMCMLSRIHVCLSLLGCTQKQLCSDTNNVHTTYRPSSSMALREIDDNKLDKNNLHWRQFGISKW